MEFRMKSERYSPLGLSLSRLACVTSGRSEDIREAIEAELALECFSLSGETYGYLVYRIQAVALTCIARRIDPACLVEVLPVR